MPTSVKRIADHLRRVELRSPAELIIEQLHDLIAEGVLKPGQKLPSERIMAERFGVSRGIVRGALRKLEFYGVVRTLPQSGTVLENLGATTLAFLLENLLDMQGKDYVTLAEARQMIETHAAGLAAKNATPEQIREIRRVHDRLAEIGEVGQEALEENMLLHLRIAAAGGNPVIRSFVSQIEPEIMRLSIQVNAYRDDRISEAVAEHEAIVRAIEKRDPAAAMAAMTFHLDKARKRDTIFLEESGNEFTRKAATRRSKE